MPTHHVFMLRPEAFGFNPQTAGSNSFQQGGTLPPDTVRRTALEEWEQAVQQLRDAGVVVHVLPGCKTESLPDEIFLNNWFSTHPGGRLILYPMLTPNRQKEVRAELTDLLQRHPVARSVTDLRNSLQQSAILEGTGSLVFDPSGARAYAVLSERTTPKGLAAFTSGTGIPVYSFSANRPVYHTNVLMCLTPHISVICMDCIADQTDRHFLEQAFADTLLNISEQQMEHFCGNMLGLTSCSGDPLLVMSSTAREAFRPEQWKQITATHKPVVLDIPVIEQYGGGSARCMLAECYI